MNSRTGSGRSLYDPTRPTCRGWSSSTAGLASGAVETSRELGGSLGLALLVSIALGAAVDQTDAFHRSVIGAAVLAVAGAAVALLVLRRAELSPSATPTRAAGSRS
jgi:sugar phosphate permease